MYGTDMYGSESTSSSVMSHSSGLKKNFTFFFFSALGRTRSVVGRSVSARKEERFSLRWA